MPGSGWRGDRSLEQWLFDEPYAFDFFQAVRLLHMGARGGAVDDRMSGPDAEPVRFRSSFDLSFAPSEIRELLKSPPGSSPEMTVAFFGIGGGNGPLPTSFTEEILERLSRHDTAVAAFLDIFHHRLVSLLYQIRRAHHLGLATEAPERNVAARYLFSLMGLGLPSLTSQLDVPASMLRYAGLLAMRPRSAAGLATLLSDYFNVPVEVQQFVGTWTDLDASDVTRIGMTGRNQAIGRTATLGTRAWIQDAGIRLRVGPVDAAGLHEFLPGGAAHERMFELARFYAGSNLRMDVQVMLRPAGVAQARLGEAKLAWSGWLRRTPAAEPDDQVRVRLREKVPSGGAPA